MSEYQEQHTTALLGRAPRKWFRPEHSGWGAVGMSSSNILFRGQLSDESMSAIAEKMLCRLASPGERAAVISSAQHTAGAGWKSGLAAGYQPAHPQVGPMERGNCADRWTERWNRRWPIKCCRPLAPGSTGLRTVRQRVPSSSGRTRRRPFDTGQGMTKMPCILQNFCYHRSNRIAGGTTCTPCFF